MSFSKQTLAWRLKLQQLVVFEHVVASGSLLAASRDLPLTQSAITKAIQELEEYFGQALLVRTRRGVLATEFGRMLLGHSRTLMADLRHLADDVNAWNAGVSGSVLVGTLLAATAELLPSAILRVRELAPQVSVQVRVGVNDKLFPDLLRGDLDIVVGLVPETEGGADLDHVVLYEEALCAVVGRQHPLTTRAVPDPAALARLAWVVPTSDSQAGLAVPRFFDALGIARPSHAVESVSIMTNLGLLVDSHMVALMPFSVARKFVHLGLLTVLPLGQAVPFGQVGYTVARGRTVTPALQRFILALHDSAAAEQTYSGS